MLNLQSGTGFTAAGLTIGNAITVTGDPTFNLNGTTVSSGGITGAGDVVLNGAPSGALLLQNANNTYSGATTINDHTTLLGGSAGAFSAASATTINTGGTLDLGGFAQTVNSVSLAGGTVQDGSLTSSGGIVSTGGTVNGISGSTGLTANGGTTTLLGANGLHRRDGGQQYRHPDRHCRLVQRGERDDE